MIQKQAETLNRLGLMLQLARKARLADRDELNFVLVNETRSLIDYRQATLFKFVGHKLKVEAVSGLATLDESSPYLQWLGRLAAHQLAGEHPWRLAPLDNQNFPPQSQLATEWQEKKAGQGLWLPLLGSQNKPEGALLFFRPEKWADAEQHILSYLADSYGQALGAFAPPPHKAWLSKIRKKWRILAVLFLLLSLYPARESVLAPAEVTASRPELVRASMEGVVAGVTVKPNQEVAKGQVLARLDDAQLLSRLSVAKKVLEMARAEYRQMQHQALTDNEAKARLPQLQGRISQLASEAAYVESLLKRTDIVSQSDGVAVFDDPTAWLGRPVALGEKIMLVADPKEVELTISLPMTESLPLTPGAEAVFFANTAPGSPVHVRLNYVSYQASDSGGGTLTYTLRGTFVDDEVRPRLGLRGTAKVYHARRPLILTILRHPLRLIRQTLGW